MPARTMSPSAAKMVAAAIEQGRGEERQRILSAIDALPDECPEGVDVREYTFDQVLTIVDEVSSAVTVDGEALEAVEERATDAGGEAS